MLGGAAGHRWQALDLVFLGTALTVTLAHLPASRPRLDALNTCNTCLVSHMHGVLSAMCPLPCAPISECH